MDSANKENVDDYAISGDPSKYVTLPVQNEKIWRKYQTTLDWFWTVYDVYLLNDNQDMTKLFNQQQCEYINKLLALMFTTHYTTINKELFMQFMTQVDIKEASYYFGSQADAKKTHCLMYSMLLNTFLENDSTKKEQMISNVVSIPEVRDFLRWSIQGTSSKEKSFAERLLAFATIQGIVFTAPFVLFNWIKKQNPQMLSGLSNSNDLIWRDEKLNLSFSCMLFEFIEDELSEDKAHAIVREAVLHAKNIFLGALPVSLLGIENNLMGNFIEHSADKILTDLKFSGLYQKECPFDWIEEPVIETYQSKMQMNNVIMSGTFGESKFDIDTEF